MTSRSYDSTGSRRSGRERMTDDDVYQFTLRVSYLAYLLTPKTTPEPTMSTPRLQNRDSFHAARISGAISNSLYSVADLFRDTGKEGGRSVKFPEKLFKALDTKLQAIVMKRDKQFTDQYTQQIMAVFWSSMQASERSSQASPLWRQIRENRKIEELILHFVTIATQHLRKNPALSEDAWKVELNTQISQFVLILRDCLRTLHHVPPEITSRLEMYTAKLTDGAAMETRSVASGSRSSVYGAQSPMGGSAAPQAPSPALPPSISEMPLVKLLGHLFNKTDDDLQRDVNALRRFCTEKAALIDLKTCLKNINADMPFPGRREDFESQDAYNQWRTQETSLLSQLMLMMMQTNPQLAKSMPSSSSAYTPPQRPSSLYSQNNGVGGANGYTPELDPIADDLGEDDEPEAGHNFTYIPPNPRKYYKRLLEVCMRYDLDAMVHLPEDQEVSLGILSPRHLSLLNECSLRWRISHQYRVATFLDIIQAAYERGDVPIECVPEGMQAVEKAVRDLDTSKWTNADFDYVATTYGALCTMFLRAVFEAFDNISKLKASEIEPFVNVLESVQKSGLVERYRQDINAHLTELENHVHGQAIHEYTDKSTEEHSKPEPNRALPLLYLTDYLEKRTKLLTKRFPKPLLGTLDIVSVVLDSQAKCFINDLDNARIPLLQASQTKPPQIPIQDMISLYNRTKLVFEMHAEFCHQFPIHYDYATYFEPYVLQWLVNTDMQIAPWVHAAISVDKFEAEGEEGHSSSITDLFANLRGPIDFILELKWPDPYQEARFFTALSKTVSKLVEEYCRGIEDLFMEEMFPRQPVEPQLSKQYALFEKAKLTLAGDKKVEPFNFTPESCVKLNNIEAARGLLDKIYARIDVDHISEVLEEHGPPVPEKVERIRFLFTVKVVLAEALVPTDASPSANLDTFVILSDEKGFRLAKTRTIFGTLNPRWDETFDVTVEKPLWVMASVRDRAIIGKHDSIARGYLLLDPKRFGDYLAHDLWLDLDPVGRILIRVSMEGEKDDPQFYFGRAFRSLKRSEADMIRVIIDKTGPLMRQYINRNVLNALIKSTQVGYDYNKAIAGVTGFYRSAIGADKADSVIPLPQKDKPRIRTEALTDEEMENAIVGLFDYFDANLQTFNSYLSPATKEIVMLKIWKELLSTIEGLLVPPLSDAPSDLKPLADKEVDIAFQWLKFLKDYMYANGEGIPLEQLQNQRYRDILSIRLYYDMSTDSLMEECVRLMQPSLRGATTVKKRAKTVYSQRNLGTIKERKREKKEDENQGNGDMILRILRMRPKTSEFISQQLSVVASAQAEQEKRTAVRRNTVKLRNKFSKTSAPPLPPLPES